MINGNDVYTSLEQDNYSFADDYVGEMIDSLLDGDEEKFDSIVSDFKNLIQDTIKFLKDQETDVMEEDINEILKERKIRYLFHETGAMSAKEIADVAYDFLVLGTENNFNDDMVDINLTLGEENKGCLSEYDDPDIADDVAKILEILLIEA